MIDGNDKCEYRDLKKVLIGSFIQPIFFKLLTNALGVDLKSHFPQW